MAIEGAEDIEAILNFDPMAEPSPEPESGKGNEPDASGSAEGDGEKQEAEGAEPEADSGGEEGAAAPEPTDSSVTPSQSSEPAQGGERDLELANLREQVRQLNERLESSAEPKPDTGQQAPTGESGADDEVPSYYMTMPNQLVEMLGSEDADERRKGFEGLVAGIGQTVHKTLRQEFQQKLEAAKAEVSQNVTGSVEQKSQTEQIRQDYFGTYTGHNSELIRPIVAKHSQAVMNEKGAKSWTPELRDEIGRRVNAELERYGLGPDGKPKQAQTPPQTPPAKPPKQQRQNTRPAATGDAVQTDIERTLFG